MNIWVYLGSRNYPPGQEFVRKLPVSTEKCSETVCAIILQVNPNSVVAFFVKN